MRLGDLRCGIGDVIVGLHIEVEEFDAAGQLARLQVIESGVAFLDRSCTQVNMICASCKKLSCDLEANAAIG